MVGATAQAQNENVPKFCSKCGKPLQPGAPFCAYCATPVAVIRSPQTEPVHAVTPSGPSLPPPPPSPPRMSRRGVFVVIAIVVIVAVVAGSVLWYEYQPGGPQNPYKVHVTQVIWTTEGQSVASSAGFNLNAGKTVSESYTEWCLPTTGLFGTYEAVTCLSGSPYIETPGFGLAWTNAPFEWSSGTSPLGVSGVVDVTVQLPSGSYTGNLTIEVH